MFVSNAVVNTAQTTVKRARPHRQHVLYMQAVTPRTTKVAIIIKNSIKLNTTIIDPMSQSYTLHFNQQQPAIPRTQNKPYAQAIRGNGPPNACTNEEEPMTPPHFLGEFKAMFNQ
jgi:hypothetical protein